MGEYQVGVYIEALKLPEPPEPTSKRHELLIGLRAEVDPAGDAASISLAFTNKDPFKVHLPLLQAASVMNELRFIASQMMDRQHLALDRGANQILELCEAAPHPAVVDVLVDPLTQDRIFIFQFDNDPVFAVRIAVEELPLVLARLSRAIAHAAN